MQLLNIREWFLLLALSLHLYTIVEIAAPGDEATICEQLRLIGVVPTPAYSANHDEGADGLLELSKPSPFPHWSCIHNLKGTVHGE
jgi:hypothetical protein